MRVNVLYSPDGYFIRGYLDEYEAKHYHRKAIEQYAAFKKERDKLFYSIDDPKEMHREIEALAKKILTVDKKANRHKKPKYFLREIEIAEA